jgi:hypothetical protein
LAHNPPPFFELVKKGNKKFKVPKRNGFFGCFPSQEVKGEKKKSKKLKDLYIWFSLCNQTYRRMIKDLY